MLILILAFSTNSYAQKEIVQSDCNPIENLTGTFDEATKTVYLNWGVSSKKMVRIKPIQEEIVEEQTFLSTDMVFYFSNNEKNTRNNLVDTTNNWMMWCGPNNGGIGVACICDIIVAARFTPTDLEAFGVLAGDEITKVRFIPGSGKNPYIFMLYEGGTSPTDPGVLKYQQEITNTLIENEYNEVVLNTPFVIDISKELWIAYSVTSNYSHFAGYDAGPRVVGKGDLIYVDYYGIWSNLDALGFDANWNIDAYVTSYTGYTYNVYRNNTLIVSNITHTNYTDNVAALDIGNYEYCVVAVLLDCESEQVCKTVEKTVKIDENKETGIGEQIVIFPNPTTGELTIMNYELQIENIEIFDVFGKKKNAECRMQNVIDISFLQAGIYFIKITTEKGIIAKKIVKTDTVGILTY